MSEAKVKIRAATLADVNEIIRVEKETWPSGTEATEEMFRSRISVFPEGVRVAEYEGKIIGVVAFLRIDYDIDHPIPTWKEVTDDGMIKNSHNPKGDSIFGIDLTAVPSAPRGTGTKLLVEVGRYATRHNLQQGILGGRVPNYKNYAAKMTIDEYLVAKNERGQPLDPEVRFYKRSGLLIGKALPGYFDDPDSLNNGVLLIWRNPFYTRHKLLVPFVYIIVRLFFNSYVNYILKKERSIPPEHT